MVNQDAPSNHRDLMGLLIDRHFPIVDPREKDVLVTLFQVAGHAVDDIMRDGCPPTSGAAPPRFTRAPYQTAIPGLAHSLRGAARYALSMVRRWLPPN